MAQDFTLMNDIISHHTERMQNLKRYYPFFKLAENTMAQYKDGQYAGLDMGYIVLAVLRFFIEENHFKDRDVTYPMYEQFMRDFLADEIPGDDAGGLIQYIFDKLCNDGRHYLYIL